MRDVLINWQQSIPNACLLTEGELHMVQHENNMPVTEFLNHPPIIKELRTDPSLSVQVAVAWALSGLGEREKALTMYQKILTIKRVGSPVPENIYYCQIHTLSDRRKKASVVMDSFYSNHLGNTFTMNYNSGTDRERMQAAVDKPEINVKVPCIYTWKPSSLTNVVVIGVKILDPDQPSCEYSKCFSPSRVLLPVVIIPCF